VATAVLEHPAAEEASPKKEKRKVSEDKDKEIELNVSVRKKLRDKMGSEGKKLKLADVTNSPGRLPQSVDSGMSAW
jgi:hypothetical protein